VGALSGTWLDNSRQNVDKARRSPVAGAIVLITHPHLAKMQRLAAVLPQIAFLPIENGCARWNSRVTSRDRCSLAKVNALAKGERAYDRRDEQLQSVSMLRVSGADGR
jgi:hypothetical protein